MATNNDINAFGSQLNAALKTAAITAAASLFRDNPSMTLEDFYAVMRPQGVTETITIGELQSALTGELVLAPIKSQPAPSTSTVAKPAPAVGSGKPKKLINVECRTIEGRQLYQATILAYLQWAGDWVTGPEILKNCGGNRVQMGTAMRSYLIPNGHVLRDGWSFSTRYKASARSSKKKPAKKAAKKAGSNGAIDARTNAGRLAYRYSIIKYLHGNKWRSGPEISDACGGNANQRLNMLRNLIEEGIVEDNGESTGNLRYRRTRKK